MTKYQRTFEEVLEQCVDQRGPTPASTVPDYNGLGCCWQWLAGKTGDGYGALTILGKTYRAHRFFYAHYNQVTIPSDLCVCHKCDNPSCVNPDHLYLGTPKTNSEDRVRRERSNTARGDKNGARTMPWRNSRHRLGGASGSKNGSHTHPEKVARGASHPLSKLDDEKHSEIFRLRATGLTQKEIGNRLGFTQSNISQILSGKTWKHNLTSDMSETATKVKLSARGSSVGLSKLNDASVVEIREKAEIGYSWSQLAKLYSVSKFTIGCVVNRKTWKHVK